MQYWQIGSGDSDRDYSSLFFDFGVALVGPGNPGRYPEELDKYEKIEGAVNKISPLHNIMVGDRIILRSGRQKIVAVGEITEGYNYSDLFRDIDGWDLQHFVKVAWREIDKNFKKNWLSMSTLERLNKPEVREYIDKKWPSANPIQQKYKLERIQVQKPLLNDMDIEGNLIDQGLPVEKAENMTKTIARVRKVGKWYMNTSNQYASEHEIRTFLVIPFLQSLGWPAQRMGIEVATSGQKRIDIVLYKDPKRDIPVALIETKKIWTGLEQAFRQLENYSKQYKSVKYLITTTGLRYVLHEKIKEEWKQTAYMNFSIMLPKHPCYPDVEGVYYLLNRLIP